MAELGRRGGRARARNEVILARAAVGDLALEFKVREIGWEIFEHGADGLRLRAAPALPAERERLEDRYVGRQVLAEGATA
jgi:hypothetical protein